MESKINLEEVLDIILKHAKWFWETETSEAGRINCFFAVILLVAILVAIIGVFIGFDEELFKFLSLILLIPSYLGFLCYSLKRVTSTEQESMKIRGYHELKAKYPTKTAEEIIKSEKTEPLDEKSAPSRYKILNKHAIAATLSGFFMFISLLIMNYMKCNANVQFFFVILIGFVGYLLVIFLSKK